MHFDIKVEPIDMAKVPAVSPTTIRIYLPDELPDAPYMIIATEAMQEVHTPKPTDAGKPEEEQGKLLYRATIYREVELPTAAVSDCFVKVGWKTKVDVDKAAALLAMFNYKAIDNLSDVITPA